RARPGRYARRPPLAQCSRRRADVARDGDRMRRRGATGKVLRGAGNSRRRGERIPASSPTTAPRGEGGGHLIFRVVSSLEGTVTARLLCAAGRGRPRATDSKMTRAPPAGSLLHRGGGACVAAGRSVWSAGGSGARLERRAEEVVSARRESAAARRQRGVKGVRRA